MKKQKGRKILIIEDERFLLEMYQMCFEKAGYNVLVANNGTSGIQTAESENPDLIIVDILLPNQSGYEVIKAVRQNTHISKTPILVFSNLGQIEEINQGMDLGANGYVVKTDVTPIDLLKKVERTLDLCNGNKCKKRILIINNDLVMAEKYKALLSKNAFVEISVKGFDGLRMATYGDFNLILLDMSLSTINGYEALHRLKEDLRTKYVPVLVLSDSDQEKNITEVLEIGAEKYFVKSNVSVNEVVDEIKNILEI